MFKKTVILGLVIVSGLALAPARAENQQKIYLVPINYDSGQLSFDDITVAYGFPDEIKSSAQLPSTRYWVELVSFSGRSLEKRQFGVPLRIFYSPPLVGQENPGPSEVTLKKTSLALALPYHSDGKMFYLYDLNGNHLAEADVSKLADFCGDKVCRSPETTKTCPADCPAPAVPAWLNVVIFIAIAVIIIIVLVAGYILWRRKQRNSIPPNNQL